MINIKKLNKISNKFSKKLPNLQIQISSPNLDSDFVFSSSKPDQVFHSASVGKLATAIVIIKAIEQNRIDWETKVIDLLNEEVYKGLFISLDMVTISHLLSHTSGVNDYFEGILSNGKNILEDLIANPTHLYTPIELLNLTRYHQKPIGNPGEKFLYSDTGFVLLGMIAETVFKKPFHIVLREELFALLEMNDTGLCFYDEAFEAQNLAPVIIKKIDIHTYQSLSVDYAGGGLYTTTSDLTKLIQAVKNLTVISKESYLKMCSFNNRFEKGLHYGLGLMEVHFEEFFFLLKGLPRLQGHLGVLGVHAWFDKSTDTTYIINVGDIKKMVPSFQLLIQLVQVMNRS